ncbi:Mfa1 family fimbria major subunit [Segatella copri]|uniref:Mfa1 family fimbria major subunit n=1 Tax=Segatella copri TaxID=165179 RepID=A0AAW5TYR3_9BACT|nr:Mfa1 family fimbria major subunit [Segatella copri]MCW4077846.1 Mfa1 family fimbria major subunit [Segatella copri]MCW4092332.1 Mfa1 family fimbria major subunit [Segatella copri]MCW4108847.1 Mfa1 family fimbria major subunit [Segatella copri]
MRLKYLFGMAAMLALAASCSENELGESGGTGANENGPHYATFTIKLPTTNGTRADGEPTYDDGTADEYAVNNATLLVFRGKTGEKEADAKFVESVELGDMKPWTGVNDDPNVITTEANITAKLNNFESSYTGNYYAVIMLNNNMTGSNKKVKLPANGNTFSDWQKANVINSMASEVNGFYMANAVKVNGTTTSTLVTIDKNKVTTNESAAQSAATIYVERGVAKVTMTAFSEMNVKGLTGDKVTITAWDLDVTNKKSYPVHNVDNYDSYGDYWGDIWEVERFTSGHPTFNRAHWGIDPNYSTISNDKKYTDDFNYKAKTYDFSGAGDATAPKYCLENTFSLGHMYQNQTTRVIMKATYVPSGLTAGETFYMFDGKSGYFTEGTLTTQISTAITNAGYTATDFSLPLTDMKKAGKHLLTANDITKTSGSVEVNDEFLGKVNAALGLSDNKKISTYYEGVSYYIARIKHFGDALTPWNSGDPTYGTGAEAKKKYLGRYGMVRNNWYELQVNSISNPGSPDVPEVNPDSPDDEGDKYYINCSVRILSWAKRVHGIDL